MLDHMVNSMLCFVRNCQAVFQRGCTILHPTSSERFTVTISQRFGGVSVPDFGHFNKCSSISLF